MPQPNFTRMIQLADEVFDVRNDPGQISVNEQERQKLTEIHPSTLTQLADENGPYSWMLLVPTTIEVMKKFIHHDISEKQLLEQTPLHGVYDAIYLCSALTLEEYRHKGATKKLAIDAINDIRKAHAITSLFVWPFTPEGDALAEAIAKAVDLPLLTRE